MPLPTMTTLGTAGGARCSVTVKNSSTSSPLTSLSPPTTPRDGSFPPSSSSTTTASSTTIHTRSGRKLEVQQPTDVTASTATSRNPATAMQHHFVPGQKYESRERLHLLVREDAKARGYIIKQSVTSTFKVNWYCANKYASPKCPAGIKATCHDEVWTITDFAHHTDACTKNREKILGRKLPPSQTCNKQPSSSSSNASRSRHDAQSRSSSPLLSSEDGPYTSSPPDIKVSLPTPIKPDPSSSIVTRPRSSSTSSSTSSGGRSKRRATSTGEGLFVAANNAPPSPPSEFASYHYHETPTLARRRRSTTGGSTEGHLGTGPGELQTVTIYDPSFHFPGVNLSEENRFKHHFGQGQILVDENLMLDPGWDKKRKRGAV